MRCACTPCSKATVWNVMCMHALQASSLAEVCWGMWCLVRFCRQFEQDMVWEYVIWSCSNLSKTCFGWLLAHGLAWGACSKSWSCAWYVVCFIVSWWMKDGYSCLLWLFHLKLLKLHYCMKCDVHACFAGFFPCRGVLGYVVPCESLQTIWARHGTRRIHLTLQQFEENMLWLVVGSCFGLGPMFKILKLCVICVLFLRQLVNERWVFLVTVVVSFEPCSKSWSCAWYVFCFIGSWWMKDEYFWLVWLFHLKLLKLFYENMKLFEHSCLPGYFSWRGVLAYVVSREGLQTT